MCPERDETIASSFDPGFDLDCIGNPAPAHEQIGKVGVSHGRPSNDPPPRFLKEPRDLSFCLAAPLIGIRPLERWWIFHDV